MQNFQLKFYTEEAWESIREKLNAERFLVAWNTHSLSVFFLQTEFVILDFWSAIMQHDEVQLC